MGKSNFFRKLGNAVASPVKAFTSLLGISGGSRAPAPIAPPPPPPVDNSQQIIQQQIAQQQVQIQQQTQLAQAALTERKAQIESAQIKLVDSAKRANRRRVRGGMFGDVTPAQGSAPAVNNPRLG